MRRDRGFSLAELLMALLILTIVITTSMAAFLERNRRQQQAREIVLAYQALASEAEYWRRLDFHTLQDRPTFHSPNDLLSGLDAPSRIVTVRRTSPTVKNVLLTIRWRGGQREAKLEIVRVDTGGQSLW